MSGVSRRSVLDDRADRPLTARLEAILGRTLRILVCGVATFAPVSYTHLTLPTIYSV